MTSQGLRVLVTDGANRAALAVTRSLGRHGYEVLVGEKETPSLAQTSKYCAAAIVYPDPATASEAFIAALAEEVRTRQVDVLVPVSDITTFLITSHRQCFGSCAVPFADASVIRRAANKIDLVQTAQRLGVPVPATIVIERSRQVDSGRLTFPLVIKPRQSRVHTPRGWLASEVSFAANEQELTRDLAARPDHEFPLMLQERIVGPGLGVFAFYHQGRPVAWFMHRRLRERPPWGGVSVLSESMPVSPVARDYAARLLDDLTWQGIAMVEFKEDVRDGVPKLMEINGRFWGSLQLAIDAGLDFPALLVQSLNGRHLPECGSYRVGVRNRWLWGDVDSLLLALFGRDAARQQMTHGRLRAAYEFLKLWGANLHYENPKLDDLRPWAHETRQWLSTATSGRIPSSIRRQLRASVDTTRSVPAAGATIVSTLEATGLTPTAWNALAARSDTNSVFHTHEWASSWWDTFGRAYQPLFIVARDGGGLATLVVDRTIAGDRVIRFMGDSRADYCDVMAAPGDVATVEALFAAVLDGDRWDVIDLKNIPARSQTIPLLTDLCRRRGRRILVSDQFACPALEIEGREAEVRALSNKSSLRRRQNYFTRMGQLDFRDLTVAAEIEPWLDAFFDQHVRRWRRARQRSLFEDALNREFYRTLTRRFSGAGWCLFSIVAVNEAPVAFHFGFDYNGSVIWYKPAFDVAHAQYSPGLVMVRHLIDYALRARRRELDYTVGDEPFKRRFSNTTRKTVRMQIFRDPMRYMLAVSRHRLRAALQAYSRTPEDR